MRAAAAQKGAEDIILVCCPVSEQRLRPASENSETRFLTPRAGQGSRGQLLFMPVCPVLFYIEGQKIP